MWLSGADEVLDLDKIFLFALSVFLAPRVLPLVEVLQLVVGVVVGCGYFVRRGSVVVVNGVVDWSSWCGVVWLVWCGWCGMVGVVWLMWYGWCGMVSVVWLVGAVGVVRLVWLIQR